MEGRQSLENHTKKDLLMIERDFPIIATGSVTFSRMMLRLSIPINHSQFHPGRFLHGSFVVVDSTTMNVQSNRDNVVLDVM